MLTTDILRLKSQDGAWETVKDVLEDKDIDSLYHRAIREEMRKAGINLVPVYVDDDWLRNGHHRVKIAMSLGHEEMMVSDYEPECGFEEGWRKELVLYVPGNDQYARVPSLG